MGGPPVWNDADRVLAEQYATWAAGLCGSCGTHPDYFDPAKGGHRFAMVADTHRCPGCSLTEELRRQVPEGQRDVHVYLTTNPELPAIIAQEEADRGR